jgi:hypothetical protein
LQTSQQSFRIFSSNYQTFETMDDTIISPPKWQCFDNCPICRALISAAEEGRELSEREMEEVLAEAEAEE